MSENKENMNMDPNNENANPAEEPVNADVTTEKSEETAKAEENVNAKAEPIKEQPKAETKKHPFLKTLGIALLSAACGFGGAMSASYLGLANNKTVVYKTEVTEHATDENVTDSVAVASTSIQDTIASVKDSVVEINTTVVSENSSGYYSFFGYSGGSTISEGAGSGVIVSEDGYILTCAHVIDDASTIKVITTSGETYEAKVIGSDSKSDIAVIKIEGNDFTYATLGDSDNLITGETVIAIGNPLGSLGGTSTCGIISALNRELKINNETMNLIQTDASINEGNSGGGLFDTDGNLIGITNAKSVGTTVEGLGFAIPINDAADIMNQLIESGYVTDRATLGVKVAELSQDSGNYKAGLYVVEIIDGSGAEAAGLQSYDRIIALNDTEISSYQDLSTALSKYAVGDVVTLTVVRNSMQLDLEVTLTGPIQTED